MSEIFSIFAVDDDPVMSTLLGAVLGQLAAVEIFDSAEACQARLASHIPDMILLDVSLPGMDGYSFCRYLRQNEATRSIPVTFISGHDSEEDRITGYEAGGDDFVVKPFSTDELLRKVDVAKRLVMEHAKLRARSSEAEKMAGVALSGIGENAILIQLMRELCRCSQATEVAEAVFEHAFSLGLKSVVQVRVGDFRHTLSFEGVDRPLEVSVMRHVYDMGRSFEFRNRAIFNHQTISVMINDMPFEDAMTCEKIRERLSLMIDAAHVRLLAIETAGAGAGTGEVAVDETMNTLRDAIQSLEQRQKQMRTEATGIIYRVQEDFVRSFAHLGLSGDQENFISSLLDDSLRVLLGLYAEDKYAQTMVTPLLGMLQKLPQKV